MQSQYMSRTTDTSTRDQKWDLKVAIYLPGWEKYHGMYNYLPKLIAKFSNRFFPLFHLINEFRFPHHFPKSLVDNLRWCTFFLQADKRTTTYERNIICKEKRTEFQGITFEKPLFSRYVGSYPKGRKEVFIKWWCWKIVLTSMNIKYSVTLKSPWVGVHLV